MDGAADDGIAGEALASFHALLTALDAEYVAFEAGRAKADADKRELTAGGGSA